MYKEKYEVRRLNDPEGMGRIEKPYYVSHYAPIEGGASLVFAGARYFKTLEEAEAYQEAQEARLTEKKQKGRYTMKTEETTNTINTKNTTSIKKTKPMSDAAREARNAYKRKWAKENRDKVRAATYRYWEKKAQGIEEGEV